MNSHPVPPAQDPAFESTAFDWDLFWHRHKTKILFGALAVLLAITAGIVWYVSDVLIAQKSQQALANAKDIPAWEEVVKKYPRSMAAADALMLMASHFREQGKMQESTAAFQKFVEAFPGHPLAGGALLGIGQNLDASGDPQKAILTYQQVITQYPQSYAAPFAKYGEATILLREFRRDEARRVLNDLITQFPQSQVGRLAIAQLARIDSISGSLQNQ